MICLSLHRTNKHLLACFLFFIEDLYKVVQLELKTLLF